MEIYDGHLHLAEAGRLAAWRAAGVRGMCVASARPAEWDGVLALKGVAAALGIHPWHAQEGTEAALARLSQLLAAHPTCCVGEIGLDYAARDADRARQWRVFAAQVEMAGAGRTLVLHLRQCGGEIGRLRKLLAGRVFVLHGFSGSLESARAWLALPGAHISFGAALLHPRARRAVEAAREVPSGRLLVESDWPGRLTPPECARVVSRLAEVRGEEPEAVAAAAARNWRRLFDGRTGDGRDA